MKAIKLIAYATTCAESSWKSRREQHLKLALGRQMDLEAGSGGQLPVPADLPQLLHYA